MLVRYGNTALRVENIKSLHIEKDCVGVKMDNGEVHYIQANDDQSVDKIADDLISKVNAAIQVEQQASNPLLESPIAIEQVEKLQ